MPAQPDETVPGGAEWHGARTIGSLGVSEIALGCSQFGRVLDAQATRAVVDTALDAGVNFFDTANVYGEGLSEVYLGQALGARRKDVVIASKFGFSPSLFGYPAGGAPATVRSCLEGSLRDLGTDWIDLYYLHRPDPETPIADTLGALLEARDKGMVREIGCSEFSAAQLAEAESACPAIRFRAVQNQYSLMNRAPENGVIAECARQGMALIPWFPLMGGLLTGKYRKSRPAPAGSRLGPGGDPDYARLYNERNLAMAEELNLFAEARGWELLDVAMSWLLGQPTVASIISGATRPEQVTRNCRARRIVFSDADLAELDRITAGD